MVRFDESRHGYGGKQFSSCPLGVETHCTPNRQHGGFTKVRSVVGRGHGYQVGAAGGSGFKQN